MVTLNAEGEDLRQQRAWGRAERDTRLTRMAVNRLPSWENTPASVVLFCFLFLDKHKRQRVSSPPALGT